ncbi:MAG: asparagine synthase C-terminal domain-containing protein, partial [Bacteroidota bacterium]
AKVLIPQLIDLYDEPYADSSAIPTLLVAKLARQHVTVALGGDGGDELFLGYGTYQWAERLHNPFYRTFRWPIAQLLKFGKQSRFQKAYRMFNTASTTHLPSHIFSQEQLFFTQQEIQALLCHPTDYQFTPSFPKGETPAASQSLFDLSYYLPDDLLVKIDRATMRSGLEARVPLLDHQVVAFALQLSTKLKYRQGERKYLLKQVLYDYVPKHLFDRPKQGFSIPLVKWLREDLKYLIENHLSEKNVNHYRVINYNKVNQIKKAYLAGNDYFYNRMWSLIILHQFLEKHESNK